MSENVMNNTDKQEEDKCTLCGGILYYKRLEPCNCHNSPPCSACLDAVLACKDCDEIHTEVTDG